jgi:hypothetical protein
LRLASIFDLVCCTIEQISLKFEDVRTAAVFKVLIADAALYGHLEVVKYLRKLGIPWDQWTCTNAAGGGHLKSLKCRRSNQCPWDEETCFEAAWKGHLHYFELYGSVMTLVQGVFRVYRTYRVGTSFIYLTKHFLQTLDLIIFNLYCII